MRGNQDQGVEEDPSSIADDGLTNQDGTIAAPMFLFILAVALAAAGKWSWATLTLVVALSFSVCNLTNDIDEKEKMEIKFNIMNVGDIFKNMLRWEAHYLYEYEEQKTEDVQLLKEGRVLVLAGLAAQIRKYEKEDKSDTASLIGQESVYLAIRRFGSDDKVMTSALSLMAIIAKNEKVRQKTLFEADTFGLNVPLKAIRNSLKRAKRIQKDDQESETNAAEVQRKGFLMLGALSDGSSEHARLAVQEGGLEAALDALDWFRCHAEVINWTLWALFIFCYEEPSNKAAVIQYHGIPKIIEAMRNCPESLDVARHGVALMFDLLREETAECQANNPLDMWRVREGARAAGLHDVVLDIIESYDQAADVVMMGTELLAGTGYEKTTLPKVHIEEVEAYNQTVSSSVHIEELD